jgi:hypothetical protein
MWMLPQATALALALATGTGSFSMDVGYVMSTATGNLQVCTPYFLLSYLIALRKRSSLIAYAVL